jgi:hypothetical protein
LFKVFLTEHFNSLAGHYWLLRIRAHTPAADIAVTPQILNRRFAVFELNNWLAFDSSKA